MKEERCAAGGKCHDARGCAKYPKRNDCPAFYFCENGTEIIPSSDERELEVRRRSGLIR